MLLLFIFLDVDAQLPLDGSELQSAVIDFKTVGNTVIEQLAPKLLLRPTSTSIHRSHAHFLDDKPVNETFV